MKIMKIMKITYDPEVDASYIRFHETRVTTQHLAEGIAADYDAEGHLARIEILDVVKRLGNRDVFKQVTLEDYNTPQKLDQWLRCKKSGIIYTNQGGSVW